MVSHLLEGDEDVLDVGTGELLRGVSVGVHGHDVDVGVTEQLVDHLKVEAKR